MKRLKRSTFPSLTAATCSAVTSGLSIPRKAEATTSPACRVCTCSSRCSLLWLVVQAIQEAPAVTASPTHTTTAAIRPGLFGAGATPLGVSANTSRADPVCSLFTIAPHRARASGVLSSSTGVDLCPRVARSDGSTSDPPAVDGTNPCGVTRSRRKMNAGSSETGDYGKLRISGRSFTRRPRTCRSRGTREERRCGGRGRFLSMLGVAPRRRECRGRQCSWLWWP